MRQPDQSDIFVLPKEKKFKGYYKIARHYGWALNTTFKAGFDSVIIVEGMHSVRRYLITVIRSPLSKLAFFYHFIQLCSNIDRNLLFQMI